MKSKRLLVDDRAVHRKFAHNQAIERGEGIPENELDVEKKGFRRPFPDGSGEIEQRQYR
jgi:hypothetical protein